MRILLHTHTGATHSLSPAPNQSLAQAIWLSGLVSPPPLCSGMGRCCRCKVRFMAHAPSPLPVEEKLLGAETDLGWRLACRHKVENLAENIEIILPEPPAPRRKTHLQPVKGEKQADDLLLAVDLGTTSLHWCAVDSLGNIHAEGQEINPQMGAGSDVMSRLTAAQRPGGLRCLSELVCTALTDIITTLPRGRTRVKQMCVAANTAMTTILLQKDIAHLAAAPYALALTGNCMVTLPHLPPCYVPPQIAPFVGGDISAGYAALLQNQELAYPFLLADLGTNGEFVLALTAEKALVASVPLGPSLEGIGLSFGDMADATPGKGVVNAVTLSPRGLVPATLDGGAARRICGTGYLSLMHVLRRIGLLEEDGRFTQSPPASPLYGKLAQALRTENEERILPLWTQAEQSGNMYLSGNDVEEILKVKAAFSLALQCLLQAAELPSSSLQHIWLAGAMGSYVNTTDLEMLGFVPEGLGPRIKAVGNASLKGAISLLLHPEKRLDLARWSQMCTLLPLAEQPNFTETFIRHMRFSYPD